MNEKERGMYLDNKVVKIIKELDGLSIEEIENVLHWVKESIKEITTLNCKNERFNQTIAKNLFHHYDSL